MRNYITVHEGALTRERAEELCTEVTDIINYKGIRLNYYESKSNPGVKPYLYIRDPFINILINNRLHIEYNDIVVVIHSQFFVINIWRNSGMMHITVYNESDVVE